MKTPPLHSAALFATLAVMACAPAMTEQQAAAITAGYVARAGGPQGAVPAPTDSDGQRAALARVRRQESQAQVFGMEWRMTRLAMECDDPDIRRVAYATAAQQARHLDAMARTRPRLAEISALEDARADRRTMGARPTAAQCQRLLRVMGESAKAMRDGER